VLGPEEHLRTFSREAIVAFRERRWRRGAAFAVGNVEHLDSEAALDLLERLPVPGDVEPYEPAPHPHTDRQVEERDTNQSHLRMLYRSAIDPADPRQRAALTVYSTLLGGSMGSRLFEEIREQRGLCYSVWSVDHSFADLPVLQLGSGLESAKCGEAYSRMREIVAELHADGPTDSEVQRARAYAAGRRVIAFENTNAVARYAANQVIVHGEPIDHLAEIAQLDAVTTAEVADVARSIDPERLAVACVGPHAPEEF
jgi:predicted Zn-dependent peptidase